MDSSFANLLEVRKKRFYISAEGSIPTGLAWDIDMASVPLLWDNNIAAVTSWKNLLLVWLKAAVKSNVTAYFSIFLDFQPFDLDSFLESLHQRQQQEQ